MTGRKAEPQCDTCAAPITFATVRRQAGGTSRMPLNPAPGPTGNVAAYTDDTGRLVGRVLVKGQEPAGIERRYLPHFATCPRPRKPKPKRRAARPAPAAPAQPAMFQEP